MVAGADSIDDMALLRHGGIKKLFTSIYAPWWASPQRRQSSRHQGATRWCSSVLVTRSSESGEGVGFGYSGVRGLNAPASSPLAPDPIFAGEGGVASDSPA